MTGLKQDKFISKGWANPTIISPVPWRGASQVVLVVKNLPANAGDIRDVSLIPWRRAWQPTTVFMPGEPHGQRSLAGYGLQDHIESYMTEVT